VLAVIDQSVVKLYELADAIGVSINTLRDVIRRNPDFPVLSRGSKGVAYKFDRELAIRWWTERKSAVDGAKDQRRAYLARQRAEFQATGAIHGCGRQSA